MRSYRNISFPAGILATLCYLTFALVAFVRYPRAFTPTGNWLSDLGNTNLNPDGALFYDVGIVATGALLVLFFLGLSGWVIESNSRQRFLVRLTEALGILGSLALVMSGLFPETLPAVHGFLSAALYILLGTAFAFSVAAVRYAPTCPRWLLALGAVTAVADILYGVFNSVRLLEWITTALLLCYVCLLGVESGRLDDRERKALSS
jgi:hypothetical membrane protein